MSKDTLKNFMLEQFDYDGLKECGLFEGIKRHEYQKQADRICKYFGFKTIFEYGSIEISAHLSFVGDRPLHINESGELKEEPFLTIIPSIYD